MEVALAFTIMVLIAISAVFIALYIIANQKSSHNLKEISLLQNYAKTYEQKCQNIQTQMDSLKKENFQTLSDLQNNLHNLAGEKFQEWREKECENIRKREQETALQIAGA
jgi:hypothetical protein